MNPSNPHSPAPSDTEQASDLVKLFAEEFAESLVIIAGFLQFPAMTMEQRGELITDAREFLRKVEIK